MRVKQGLRKTRELKDGSGQSPLSLSLTTPITASDSDFLAVLLLERIGLIG
jgi:hypothetical protein